MRWHALLWFVVFLVVPWQSLAEETGRFQGTIDETTYDTPVVCFNMESDRFRFQSDEWAQKDTDQNGVIVTGVKGEAQLFLFVQGKGKTLKIAVDQFEKSEKRISYSGELVRANAWGKRTYEAAFTVVCP